MTEREYSMIKKAVILSGGLGIRLKPFTNAIPKPLLPIGEKAVLEIQIERLKNYGFQEVYLATNYKSDYIENFFGDGSRYGIRLHISREDRPLGTAGPLKLLEKELQDPFVVMNGDILSLLDFNKMFSYALQQESILTVAIKEITLPYAFGNIHFNGKYVTEIEEKPDIIMNAMAGIYVMKPEIFQYIPEQQYYGMDTMIQDMLLKNIPVCKYDMDEYWLDIGRMDDFEKAQDVYDTMYGDKG